MGVHRVIKDSQLVNISSSSVSLSAANTATNLIPSVGSGSIYITDIIISNGATAGTHRLYLNTTAGTLILGPIYLAVNGNLSSLLETPIQVSSNNIVVYANSASTTCSANVSYYLAP